MGICQPVRDLLNALAVVTQTLCTSLVPVRLGPQTLIEKHGSIGQGHKDGSGVS